MRRILGFLTVLAVSLVLVGCTKGNKEFDFDKGVLTVGMEADYAPFNWLETSANDYNFPLSNAEGGYVAGYDVEMAKLVAASLDLELKIVSAEWLALPNLLNSGQIDLIIAGMSPTEERKENILFSNPYYNVNHVVVAKTNGPLANMTELSELNGKTGVGQINTIYDDLVVLAKNKYGANHIPPLDTTPALATAVLGTVADFMIVEKPVALGLVKNNSGLKIVFETDENIFELGEGDRSLAVGLRLVDTILNTRVNEALATITQATRDTLMDQAVERSANI